MRRFAALVLLAAGLGPRASVAADGVFIPAAGRKDMVYDGSRNRVYITSTSSVLRYDVGSGAFLTPWELGGSLMGIDLSPDGGTLLVAGGTSTDGPVVHEIDLSSETSREVLLPRAFSEGAAYSVAYGADGKALITSRYNGSGWVPLRRYDPATGTVETLRSVRQDTMLCASADGGVIGFAESNSSAGPFGRYRVADGDIDTAGTNASNYEIGVSRDGTQYALPTYRGCYIYDAGLDLVTKIGVRAGEQPVGVAYDPRADRVYFAWADTYEVRVHDTHTFAELDSFNVGFTIDHPGNLGFQDGRLRIDEKGWVLLIGVPDGVRMLAVPEPATACLLAAGAALLLRRRRREWRKRRREAS